MKTDIISSSPNFLLTLILTRELEDYNLTNRLFFPMLQDATQLHLNLPSSEYHEVPLPEFNHFDFLWAIDVKTLVNDKVLSLLEAN
jgi:hypothetical protein